MNQTRYAHGSYLQMAAEWGLWIILPLGALVAATLRSWRRLISVDAYRLALAAGGVAFLVHNLIDFTAYLPAIALPAALMIGLAIEPPGSTPTPTRVFSRRAAASVALLLALALSAHAVVSGRAHALLEGARYAGDQGEFAAAARLASRAAAVRPSDPDAWAFLSEVTLVHQMDDPTRRAAGEAAAIRAVTLDPGSAIRHYTRALYHRAAGEHAAAYRETRRAHQLYPLKPLYRLRENSGPGAGR
jgi:tetratricopeptide (TPR) repeat protein